jgi:hypothetical protein
MKIVRIVTGLLLVGVWMGAPQSARAEEIVLKDGQKIVGNIVGYENDMFRIETAYGTAMVRKDKVAFIQVGPPDANPPAPPRSTVYTIGKKPARNGAARTNDAPAESPGEAPPPDSHAVDEPLPAHLREHVDVNTYYSDTFQFSMFKPPDWKIFENVPNESGSGIMAMGTDDEQTLVMVNRQVWSGTPKLSNDQVEAGLRQTYQEYHRISENDFELDGQPATRRTFTGLLEGAEWHGVAVHVIHGNMVFGIIGLTSAENFRFEEAIFNKVVKSLHFLNSTATPAAPPAAP